MFARAPIESVRENVMKEAVVHVCGAPQRLHAQVYSIETLGPIDEESDALPPILPDQLRKEPEAVTKRRLDVGEEPQALVRVTDRARASAS